MAKQHLAFLAVILGSSALFAACSSDEKPSADTSAEAGAGGEAGASNDPTPALPLNPQAVVVPAAPPVTFAHILSAGTDYKTKTEISSVNIATGAVDASALYSDGDAIAVSSAGLGFALERTNDRAYLLEAGSLKKSFTLRDLGTDTAPIKNKAYVPFLGKSAIAILDLDHGRVSRRVDLSQFDVASDGDGSVDVAGGVYDPTKKVAYFVLQRIDITTVTAPDFQLACPDTKGLIVGIDTTTDEILDLNGATSGKGIELSLVSQNSLAISADGTTLYMAASGCYDGGTLKNQGVEVVDLSDGSTRIAYAPDAQASPEQLILTASEALLETLDATYTPHWNRLDLAAGSLIGSELENVPQAPIFDGSDVLGIKTSALEYGVLVRYDVATDTVTEISEPLWAGKFPAAASTALVK